MLTTVFKDKNLSLLGFGTMRLPLLDNGQIDEEQVSTMVQYAQANGVNYYDTAYPYLDGESERVIGRVLKQFPREDYYLATKYPGHQILPSYYPEDIFEDQLQKCGVDYFDFYLLHNIYENSIQTYMDPRWNIVDYFIQQKKNGRIRHLGFSCHGGLENLEQFLNQYGDSMEFCQIQLNYLDWSLQDAKSRYLLLSEREIPIWVMEPVRGGKLAIVPAEEEKKLKALRPDESIASWAFRWLFTLPDVKMILSGMSDMEQVIDNVKTFSTEKNLNEQEIELLYDLAALLKDSLPCTACRYCCADCSRELDIPVLLNFYNQLKFSPTVDVRMRIESLPVEKSADACIACGKCNEICPQKIDIVSAFKELRQILSKMPTWIDICREREAHMTRRT